jgi:hypothetical protein
VAVVRLRDERPVVTSVDDVPVVLRRCVVEDWVAPDEVEAIRRRRSGGGDGDVTIEAFLRWNSAVQGWASHVGLDYATRVRLIPPRPPGWAVERG